MIHVKYPVKDNTVKNWSEFAELFGGAGIRAGRGRVWLPGALLTPDHDPQRPRVCLGFAIGFWLARTLLCRWCTCRWRSTRDDRSGGIYILNVFFLVCANVGTNFSARTGTNRDFSVGATIGTVAIPSLEKRGYDTKLTLGSLASGGTLGILIPPSIPLIIYGVIVEESIGDLFIAGILPGIMLASLFMFYRGKI